MIDTARKISVCLLTYNHSNLIDSTVESVLRQTISECEIILSDDCSNDGTWEQITAIAAADMRVRAIQTPYNIGMPANANFAVENSSGDYIALLHHDDIYRADLLEKWAAVLDRNPDVGFVFNPYGIHGAVTESTEDVMPGERIEGKWLLENYLFPRWGCLVRGTAMIRRSSWDIAGGMRSEYGLLADVDLWMRLSMRGAVGYVPDALISIRQQRPSYYPEIYRSDCWSWQRLKYLYEIHATNRLSFFHKWTLKERIRWWGFRLRLSLETAKWISYAIVRGKSAMVESCAESATRYDILPLRAFRKLVLFTFRAGGGR